MGTIGTVIGFMELLKVKEPYVGFSMNTGKWLLTTVMDVMAAEQARANYRMN